MKDIELQYEYKIPDEQFIDGFSKNKIGKFTYKGPQILKVTIPEDGSAYTQKLDGPVYDGEIQLDIDLEKNPELVHIAALLYGRPYDFIAEFQEVTLEDGSKYQDQSNKDIFDYYFPPRYNLETKTWTEPFLIIKDTLSPNMRTFISKAQMFIEILNMFDLDEASTVSLNKFKSEVEVYSKKVAMPWKYPDQNPFDLAMPKIPMNLVSQLANAKALLGENDLLKLSGF